MNIEYIQEKDKRMGLEAKILQFRTLLKNASLLQTLDGEIAEDWLEEYDKHFELYIVEAAGHCGLGCHNFPQFDLQSSTLQGFNWTTSLSSSPGGESTVTNGENNTDEGSSRIPHI